jgi:erythromycin esterase
MRTCRTRSLPTDPYGSDLAYPTVGSYLRRWYGTNYRSIGFTFDHGTVPGDEGAVDAPPPLEGWFERPFGLVSRYDQMFVDLRVDAPAPVREWLRGPARTRGLVDRTPEIPYDSTMSGGTLEQWFDAIVHRQEVIPARPLQVGFSNGLRFRYRQGVTHVQDRGQRRRREHPGQRLGHRPRHPPGPGPFRVSGWNRPRASTHGRGRTPAVWWRSPRLTPSNLP